MFTHPPSACDPANGSAGRCHDHANRTPRRFAMNNDLLDHEFTLGMDGVQCNFCNDRFTGSFGIAASQWMLKHARDAHNIAVYMKGTEGPIN